jgi:hypothetical protein
VTYHTGFRATSIQPDGLEISAEANGNPDRSRRYRSLASSRCLENIPEGRRRGCLPLMRQQPAALALQ